MIGRTLGPAPLSTTNVANFYYKRPTEFLDLAVIPAPGVTEMFTFLVAVQPEPGNQTYLANQITGAPSLSAVNNVAIHCDVQNSGTFTVDWGDGTTEVLAQNTDHFHVYNYDNLPASTEFRGYRQVVLSGYPTDSNNKFTSVVTDIEGPFEPGYISETNRNNSNTLDMEISSGNATNYDIGGNSRPHKMCERVALYNTTNNKLTTPQNMIYSGMQSLQEIAFVPYMHVDTTESHSEAFRICSKLRYLPDDFADPDRYWFWNSNSFYLCFENCQKLEYLPQGIFTKQGTQAELANVTEYRYMFRYCFNLKYIPELPVRTSGSAIRVQAMFYQCYTLKALPKNLRANRVTSSSSGGLAQMLFSTYKLESFSDWNLLDMDSTAKQPQSISTIGYMYECGKDTQQIVPWVGLYLDDINSSADIGSNNVGAWRCRTGAQFFAPEYYERGYINYEIVDDAQDIFNNNYCIKHYPILKFSPNTLTHSNAAFRMFFGNRSLKKCNIFWLCS